MNNNILECNCIKDSAKSIMLSLLDRTDKMESDISSIQLQISQGNLQNVGISSIIQTVVSAENGGTNVVTITKTDGTQSTFQFKNGDKGDAFVYSNFTQEQISNLQKPAADAAVLANSAAEAANQAAVLVNTAASNAGAAATNANDTASRVAQAEDLRVTAESGRVTAESSRVAEFNTLKTASEAATDKANTAATTANGVINTMSNTVSEEQFVVSATAFITCAWWGVSASPTPTAAGQYWWDGTALHVSSAVVNAQGVITGYAWSVFDLSATAVYIDGTTSAAYKYKDGAMVALTNSVAVIASQLRGINEILSKINN